MKSEQDQGGAATDEARAQMTTLKSVLSEQVTRGDLWEPIPDRPDWVHCYACGHDCRIPPGRDGICRVRFNRGGTLFVPDGYVGALQCDPVEKKPFFHALPGSLALSFGMLGCDYHCAYCFTGETRIITDRGVIRIDSLWEKASGQILDGGEAALLQGWKALAHDGRFSPIREVFRHAYRGPIVQVSPYYLPPFRCTPDHRVYAAQDASIPPSWVEARSLAPGSFLAVPKPYGAESSRTLTPDAGGLLSGIRPTYRGPRLEPGEADVTAAAIKTATVTSSRDIGEALVHDELTTGSEDLAYDVAWFALRNGCLPSIDRQVERYTVAWARDIIRGTVKETKTHFLVPIRRVAEEDFDGFVYNLEVEGSHTYTANFFAVHNCQNWITSQALRDPGSLAPPIATSPEELVNLAKAHGAPILASTYNEPLITSEWAVKVFRKARRAGLVCAYISNGNATPRVLDYLRPWVDLYKVDLKGFDEKRYHQLGGVLQTVLDTIVNLKERGFWVEVVTLVVPGFNDSDEELNGIARFLVGVDRNIPWHVTAFHQDYKMTDRPDTSIDVLLRAAEFGRAAGLNFVYAGNRPGRVGDLENTRCPGCRSLLIERIGYTVLANRIRESRCPDCDAPIPGVWSRPGQPVAAT